jgi:hypothetical protein
MFLAKSQMMLEPSLRQRRRGAVRSSIDATGIVRRVRLV